MIGLRIVVITNNQQTIQWNYNIWHVATKVICYWQDTAYNMMSSFCALFSKTKTILFLRSDCVWMHFTPTLMESILNFLFRTLKMTNSPYFARKLKLVILRKFLLFCQFEWTSWYFALHFCRQQSTLTNCLNNFRSGCGFDRVASFAATESLSKYICNDRPGLAVNFEYDAK